MESLETAINNAEMKDNDSTSPKQVGSYLWISRVRNINLERQLFEAEAHLFLNWESNPEEYKCYHEKNKKTYYNKDFTPNWKPKFLFVNGQLDKNELMGYRILKQNDIDYYGYNINEPRVKYFCEAYYKIDGKFAINCDLKNFPFDSQDLLITLGLFLFELSFLITCN